jgi:DNA-binding GntR family transcriptional regulator
MANMAGLRETGKLLLRVRGKMYLIVAGTKLPAIRTDQVLWEHEQIVDAVEKRDPHVARLIISEHADNSIDSLLAARNSGESLIKSQKSAKRS